MATWEDILGGSNKAKVSPAGSYRETAANITNSFKYSTPKSLETWNTWSPNWETITEKHKYLVDADKALGQQRAGEALLSLQAYVDKDPELTSPEAVKLYNIANDEMMKLGHNPIDKNFLIWTLAKDKQKAKDNAGESPAKNTGNTWEYRNKYTDGNAIEEKSNNNGTVGIDWTYKLLPAFRRGEFMLDGLYKPIPTGPNTNVFISNKGKANIGPNPYAKGYDPQKKFMLGGE
jgi:hypothetical protein